MVVASAKIAQHKVVRKFYECELSGFPEAQDDEATLKLAPNASFTECC